MLQLKSLVFKKTDIISNEQKKILGGGAGPHNSVKKPYALWRGYADGNYTISTDGETINFNRGDYIVGAINSEGESERVSNVDNVY